MHHLVATICFWAVSLASVAAVGLVFFVVGVEVWSGLFGSPKWKQRMDEQFKREGAWAAETSRLKGRLRRAIYEGRAADVARIDSVLRARLGYPQAGETGFGRNELREATNSPLPKRSDIRSGDQ